MSVSGIRKQFHKASQLFNERLNGAEGTKLDEDFLTMEKKVAVIQRLVLELMSRTSDYLQPNPAYRAKMSMLATLSRIGGQEKSVGYPQPEGMLGDCMVYYSKQLGPRSAFGGALSEVGVALKQMSCFREGLDICVKQNFIDPLHCLHDNELREIGYHLRKLEGRRLDLDYRIRRRRREEQDEADRRRKREEEDMVAWEKFTTSKDLAERSMFTLLHNDVQQISQLSALIGSFLEFHRHSLQILAELQCRLQTRLTAASNQPRRQFQSKRALPTTEPTTKNPVYQELSIKSHTSPEETEVTFDQPCCRALYSFQPFRERELRFKEGDIIILTNRIDSNWYEGMLGGQSGFLPVSYVDVLVPLQYSDNSTKAMTFI